MCGIVGVIHNEAYNGVADLKKVFWQMLFAGAFRGMHSTGMFMVPKPTKKEKGIQIFKKDLPAYDFLDMNRTNALINWFDDYNYIVGHNRHATQGSVNQENAHPFSFDNICLVHNGTVTNAYQLYKGNQTFPVDSQACAYALDTVYKNSTDTKKILAEFRGDLCFVWYNSHFKTLNFYRNEGRPLALAYIKKPGILAFASESGMVKWICERNGFEIESLSIFKPYVWSTIRLDDGKFVWDNTDIPKPAPPPAPVTQIYNHNYHGDNWHGAGKKKGSSETPAIMSSNVARKPEHIDFLRQNGLALSQEVVFEINDFVPYGGSNIGAIEGYMRDTFFDVVVHNVPRASYEKLEKEKWVKSKLVNCFDLPHGKIAVSKERIGLTLGLYDVEQIVGPDPIQPKNDKVYKMGASQTLYDVYRSRDMTEDDTLRLTVEQYYALGSSSKSSPPKAEAPNPKEETANAAKKDETKALTSTSTLTTKKLPSSSGPSTNPYEDEEEDTSPSGATFRGPYGQYISKEKWAQLTSEGCANCTGPIHPITHDNVTWWGDAPICADCSCDGTVDPVPSRKNLIN